MDSEGRPCARPNRAELRSVAGDPTAYRIRGAMIALRRDQADLVYVLAE